jgi:hypothetical protein
LRCGALGRLRGKNLGRLDLGLWLRVVLVLQAEVERADDGVGVVDGNRPDVGERLDLVGAV